MNSIRTSIKKHKNLYLFLTIIFIFGILSGILFYFNQDLGMRKTISLNMNNIFSHNVFDLKNTFIHLSICLIIIAASFIFMGEIIHILVLFLEGVSIGFLIPLFFNMFKWRFFYTFGLYFFLTKFIYIFLFFYLGILSFKFIKEYIIYLKTKKIKFFSSLKKMFLTIILLVLNDFLTFFIFNKLLIFLLG